MSTYYQILGVSSSSSLKTIYMAYRQKAVECHPERGGSHAKIVKVNESWHVLSKPKARKHYDQLLKTGQSVEGQFIVESGHAADYPKRWVDFEQELNAVGGNTSDHNFRTAELFRSQETDEIPGVVCWIFICFGVFVGIALAISAAFSSFVFGTSHPGKQGNPIGLIVLLLVPLGGYLGKTIHDWLKTLFATKLGEASTLPPVSESHSSSDLPISKTAHSEAGVSSEAKGSKCQRCGRLSSSLVFTDDGNLCSGCIKKSGVKPPILTGNYLNMRKSSASTFSSPPNNEAIKAIFKNLLIIDISLSVASLVAAIFISGAMQEAEMIEELTGTDMIIFSLSIVYLLVFVPAVIITWVGMFNLKNWASWAYLAIFVTKSLLSILFGIFDFSFHWGLVSAIDSLVGT